ncbi:MAG: transcriptional regulator [Thermoprotei archaeon]|nr:MAG: transcriptional regulator [Thermoprotei archaeon]
MILSVPRVWREIRYRYRLIGCKCTDCGAVYFPPRPLCIKCGSRKMKELKLSEDGVLINYTIIHYASREFKYQTPFIVGVVKLREGVKVLAQIVDVDLSEIKEGIEVEAVFRKLREQGEQGIIEYGLKFRPKIKPK